LGGFDTETSLPETLPASISWTISVSHLFVRHLIFSKTAIFVPENQAENTSLHNQSSFDRMGGVCFAVLPNNIV
jgi:transposase